MAHPPLLQRPFLSSYLSPTGVPLALKHRSRSGLKIWASEPRVLRTQHSGDFPTSDLDLGDGFGLVGGRALDEELGKDFALGNERLGLEVGSEGASGAFHGGNSAARASTSTTALPSTPPNIVFVSAPRAVAPHLTHPASIHPPTLDAHPRSTHSFNTTIDDPMDDTL
ncbi:hypothetical protein HMN09_00788000 [Mycena chlorophos]|uniref:Uncharacterized protein n=1 Tax=Mycena chlorophos TaxID=658473 RepID=A0A8H6SSP1_MYCCL|nr:hypothetical protein HMN09_00788000 [Mycena chlorophos]